jgi:hypothetical protein
MLAAPTMISDSSHTAGKKFGLLKQPAAIGWWPATAWWTKREEAAAGRVSYFCAALAQAEKEGRKPSMHSF